MNASTTAPESTWRRLRAALNGRHHKAAVMVFTLIVVAHWAEHLAQAFQIWALGEARPQARGVLGELFPWLVSSEWLHYGYAIVMLLGLWLLRAGFVGRARRFWDIALFVQVWHHFEHLLLLVQALVGANLAGEKVPTSMLQLLFPRVELHLFYNAIVTIPMVIAVVLHFRPSPAELAQMRCSCAERARNRSLPAAA
ncbi:MAG TPA: hypothetical protein VE547_20915 [Mycobacteriales bacterium]|nr:hypothetical protein [Mycobacteriales bacterium]